MFFSYEVLYLTEIYLVRHCEALGNVSHIFQGTTDLDITDSGAKQLSLLTKRFNNIHIDKVYSSPLIRTKKTAEAIIANKQLNINLCDGLIEIHGGIVEGKPVIETFGKMPDLLDAWDNHPQDFAPENGEKMVDAYARIWNTVLSLAKENCGKTIALATHGGVLRCLLCRLMFNDINKLKDTPFSDNTAVTKLVFDDSFNPEIIFYNDITHLGNTPINSISRVSTFLKEARK